MQNWLRHSDPTQMRAVKEALHISTVPSCGLVCRDDERNRVLEFCKECVEQEKAGSLYVCGCPGTGKTLSINKVKESLLRWADEVGYNRISCLVQFYILEMHFG
jgi:cell division control protein 6